MSSRKTYKELYPSGTGIFTAKEISEWPYGGYDAALKKKLAIDFLTYEQAAREMDCHPTTARKYLKNIPGMVLEDNLAFQRVYLKKQDAMPIIKSFLMKKVNKAQKKREREEVKRQKMLHKREQLLKRQEENADRC